MTWSVKFSGLPSLAPCTFFACRAALVRLLIHSRSWWASAAKMPMVRVLASGISAQTKSVLSRKV